MSDNKILFNSKCTEEFRFLSNFYPCTIVSHGVTYASAEHLYQTMKALYAFNDELAEQIKRSKTAAQTKALGKKVKFTILDSERAWDNCKADTMLSIVRAKFEQNIELAGSLLLTEGFDLVEYAPWGDQYWGVDKNLIGRNTMGQILMRVREELKERR